MRKTDIRKWVHGILDLLPLLVIPVFMVYSHRHTIDSYSVEVPQNKVVDFNQQFNLTTDKTDNNIIWNADENGFTLDLVGESSSSYSRYFITNQSELNITPNDKYLFRCDDVNVSLYLFDINTNVVTFYNDDIKYITNDLSYEYSQLRFYIPENFTEVTIKVNLYNLTQMFGVGNEPTSAQFENWYSQYYDYTLSRKELIKDYQTILYDDTDIGSQFVYSLYNVTNNYFNFNNVFGFGNLQDWFMLNIFGGNAPLSFYIVWQIVLYEFLMDLIFLIYGLFMWFIDMCEKLMNKPLNAIK